MLDFLFRNWSATSGVLSNPVRNLLLRISIKKSMLSSISCRMQAMLECQSQSISWIIECAHQCIDQNRNIMLQFANIKNRGNLLASELKFLKNRILSEEFANGCWDVEFSEV
jgi:hypothetical protein